MESVLKHTCEDEMPGLLRSASGETINPCMKTGIDQLCRVVVRAVGAHSPSPAPSPYHPS